MPGSSTTTSPKLRVLLVEDHADVGDVVLVMLKRLGHVAQRASTVGAAAKLFECELFDVVIVDYRLPDGTGFDVLKRLTPGKTRVILLTGYSKSEIAADEADQFARVLQKPVDMDMLAEALK